MRNPLRIAGFMCVMACIPGVMAPIEALSCAIGPLSWYRSQTESRVIFVGVVRDLETIPAGQVVTFDVERVWLGQPTPRFVAHNRIVPSFQWNVRLEYGERYFINASPLSRINREAFAVPEGHPAFAIGSCSVHAPFSEAFKTIVGDEPGYLPGDAARR